ncbi:MAG: PAS domain-containing protein [Acidobacteriales bacterium]|nr:PAS domain-containing protein [Terriglobales bacterium]
MESAPNSFAVVEDGILLYANPAFARIFGARIDLRGRALSEFIPQISPLTPGSGTDPGSGKDVTAAKGAFPAIEFRQILADGTALHLQTACGQFQVNGREFQVISTRDLSGDTKTIPQLPDWFSVSADKPDLRGMLAAGRMVNGVAHDFNNLLGGIILYSDLLINGLESSSRLCDHARQIRRAGEKGAALIRQLLDVSRPQQIKHSASSWNHVIDGIRDFMARTLGSDIQLILELAADLKLIKMDPAEAGQIVLNLALNARDAMPRGGRLTMTTKNFSSAPLRNSASQPLPAVEFTVKDTGMGMNAQTRLHIFDPFFTTKDPAHGAGIGLSTVYSIVKKAGGSIDVWSKPGKGARIRIQSPQYQEQPASSPTAANLRPGTIRNKKKRGKAL